MRLGMGVVTSFTQWQGAALAADKAPQPMTPAGADGGEYLKRANTRGVVPDMDRAGVARGIVKYDAHILAAGDGKTVRRFPVGGIIIAVVVDGQRMAASPPSFSTLT